MIALAIACLLQQSDNPIDALPAPLQAAIIRYQKTVWAQGQVMLTVSAGGQSTKVLTDFAYEKPSKLYIKQTRSAGPGALITCDGSLLTYNNPSDNYTDSKPPRLKERVDNGRKLLTIGDLYKACAASLVDRSSPLDLIMAHPEDAKFFAYQLVNIRTAEAAAGRVGYVGDFRAYGRAPISGKFHLVLSSAGDIQLYEVDETYMGNNSTPIRTRFSWSAQVELDGKLNRSVFKVVM